MIASAATEIVVDAPPTPKNPRRYLYVPESFDPLTALPEEYHGWADYACYVLSAINQRIVFERLDDDAYVPLMSALLKRVLPWRDYKRILDVLIHAGVIERHTSYQRRAYSKGHRLTERYRGQAHRRHLVTKPALLRKLAKVKEDMEAGIIDPVHRHLYRFLRQVTFAYPGNIRELGLYARQAQDLIDGDYTFKVCEYGRVHTNLSNLKRELRPYLRYQGRGLVNIDVRNSQPLFLGIVCVNWYLNQSRLLTANAFNVEKWKTALYQDESLLISIFKKGGREGPPLCGDIFINSLPVPDDMKLYLTLCQEGAIYEYLMDRMKTPHDERDAFKRRFFFPLFGDKHDERQSPLTTVLESDFPSVISVVRQVKRKDHRRMAQLLQRFESSVCINRVVRRMMEEHPDAFVGTIHDSWLTTPDHTGTLTRIVREEFAKVGVVPTLRAESLVMHTDTARLAG